VDPYSRSLVDMAREVVHLELPQPPTANMYWRKFRNRIVRSAVATAYKEAVWMLSSRYRVHTADGHLRPLFQTEPVAVTIKWYRALGRNNQRQGDLDNRLKVLLDALQDAVYTSDRQVVELHAYRIDGDEAVVGGRVLVDVVPRVS